MGVTTHDLFGRDPRGERAEPGTYGEPPTGGRLPDGAQPGAVRLQVADLGRSVAFYAGTLGFHVLEDAGGSATLGSEDTRPLVELTERAGARPVAPRTRLGLFHVAYLLPDRPALGRVVRHLAARGIRFGAGDHLVSEALYLTDPDGLGIEVYADRPRSAWRRVGRELMMATDPVDLAALAAAGADAWSGMPAGTRVGHVHLHVGDLAEAGAHYADALGLARMVWSYPGALFLAAGGYHHHLGLNTWAGPAARPPADDEARLLAWSLELPTADAVEAAGARLAAAGRAPRRGETDTGDVALEVVDPWGTALHLRVAGAPAAA